MKPQRNPVPLLSAKPSDNKAAWQAISERHPELADIYSCKTRAAYNSNLYRTFEQAS